MNKLIASISILLILTSAYLAFHSGQLAQMDKEKIKDLTEILKRKERDEMIHKDSIRLLKGYLQNVITQNSRLLDSIEFISNREKLAKLRVKEIRVINYNAKELEDTLINRYTKTTKP